MDNYHKLEALRKKAKTRFFTMLVVSAILFVLVLAFVGPYEFRTASDDPLVTRIGVTVCAAGTVAIGFFALSYALFVKRAYHAFNLSFKNDFVLPIIQQSGFFQNLSYSPQGGFSYNEIRDSAVVASGDPKYYHSEDFLSGTYRGIGFLYGDVETKHIVSSGKRREVRTIFEGQVMRFSTFDETKRSFGYLQIFEKGFLFNVKGWTAQNKIQTENEAFNKRFQVYSADALNAFYILTPQMLEQIMHFADEVGEQISITFTGPMMYVAIHRIRSMFNAYIDKPVQQQQEDIDNDIKLLCRVGDLLIMELNDPVNM